MREWHVGWGCLMSEHHSHEAFSGKEEKRFNFFILAHPPKLITQTCLNRIPVFHVYKQFLISTHNNRVLNSMTLPNLHNFHTTHHG